MASYPPTEAGEISNDSLFSDSMEFDAAEKPAQEHGQEQEIAPEHENRDIPLEEPYPEEEEPPREPTPEPVKQGAAHLKPRKTAGKQATNWVPVDLSVPDDDPEDEFDIGTAQKPVYDDEDGEGGKKKKKAVAFQHGEPDMEGDVTNCFEEPGLLYRIVDKKNKTWAFYNDSLNFEVHVVCTFGKHSKLEALENTQIHRDANGDYIAEVTVYPCETEMFVRGFVNGFTSKLRALPLSDDFYQQRAEMQHESTIQQEIDAIREIVGDETDPEVILQVCLENNLPFVDLSFPPEQSSIDTGASKPFKQLPWARPANYLKPEQVDQIRLFRDGITAGDVNQGELGDCWLMCALATHAENPNAVMQMFRHPKGPQYGRRERAIGAYRVTFNKNGLWRSVLVDDYLPLIANTPKFAHSNDPCELWPAILEKAFAKLHKSYAMIQSGDPVHALTDMTGCPSMRFDDAYAEAQEKGAGNTDLFQRWLAWDEAGYQLVLTTPGKAPAITPGSNNVPDFSEEPELEQQMAGTSLLPGHAYSVLAVRSVDGQHLVQVRNPWRYGAEWAGKWSRTSPLWQQHPEVASACGYDENDETVLWMAYEDVLQYFNGGGVHFRDSNAYDYRLPLTFSDCRPSAAVEIEVAAPTTLMLTLSNIDHRGIHTDSAAADEDPNNTDYPPVMLSLCQPTEPGDDVFRVKLNSSADTTEPSDSKWTFLQAREISMLVQLDPKDGPTLLVPRLLETDTTAGGADVGEPYEALVNPVHFLNNYERSFPGDQSGDSKKEIPVTLGIRVDAPLGAGGAQVRLKKISGSNSVFENFPKFPTDDVEDVEELYFQVKEPAKGFADEKMGTELA